MKTQLRNLTVSLFGALVLTAIVGGWYLAAWWVGGDSFFEKHVLKENVFRFLGDRERVRRLATQTALDMLRRKLSPAD